MIARATLIARTVFAGVLATVIGAAEGLAQTQQSPLPDVHVTAPAPAVSPNALPHVTAPIEQNPYFGRNRVEEDMFIERPCGETRMAPQTAGKCLEGYKIMPGYVPSSSLRTESVMCMVQLDVVSSSTADYTFEADAFVFDPYLATASGTLPRECMIDKEPSYDLARLQDMNSMTRRGSNWRNYVGDGDNGGRSAEYSDGKLNCVALRKLGPNWHGGVVWMVHASLCRLNGAAVQPADVHAVLSLLKIRVYDPRGNLRPPPDPKDMYVPVE